MIPLFKFKKILPSAIICLMLMAGCQADFEEPVISLEDYKIEEGFELEVVASEPFLEAPVAIDFDNQGRIWTVEMRGYMQTLTGESEEMPNGVISIMQDLDGDGVADHSKVFLEGLVLPRAIAHVYGGLLYAEPPNLWFVEIENDQPGKKVLVDSLYADEGNVEHQPNGLMMNIDNWIYNARSHFRYQRRDGVWIKEPTTFRGQWGITKDNFGRLYYNNNSTQIMGDYALPNVLTKNQYYTPKGGLGKVLTRNQRVYPLHATLVNRGYEKGVLDADSMLVNVTSSCGPLVYRGGYFPADYDQNAFVCAPEVNLIKRNLLNFNGPVTTATQAWDDKEFLASTDEGFRPVNLFNGPDGGMYVVDMHRGIIQHGAYMTTYLRERLAERGMDKIIGMGRILRIKNTKEGLSEIPDFASASTEDLVSLLRHKNGWVRDRAQQLIIHENRQDATELLKTLLLSDEAASIHALYSLKGLEALDRSLLVKVAQSKTPELASHGLLLLSAWPVTDSLSEETELLNDLVSRSDPLIDMYLMTYLGSEIKKSGIGLVPVIMGLLEKYPESYYLDALMGSLSGYEKILAGFTTDLNTEKGKALVDALGSVVTARENDKKFWIYEQASLAMDDRTHGLQLYRNTCAACHGQAGAGIEGLAPPLDGSEYIKGPVKRLGLVLLHGMKGPLTVNGQRYEFNAQMPGLSANPNMSDQDITDIITYLSNAFGESKREASPELVKSLREIKPKQGAYTEAELLEIINNQ
ncbi:MAG: c-type cytochrome [Roseivirga sp.]|nr:c-type cytochrome [Roseivirga sp.]